MANEYLVNSSDLTAVANAIRTKGGTSDELEFPGGFVDAVGAIQAGGGGGDADDLINGEIESVSSETVLAVKDCAFQSCKKLTSVNLPNVTKLGNSAFRGCIKIKALSFPNVTLAGTGAAHVFSECTSLETIDLPNLVESGSYMFSSCPALKNVNLPKLGYYNSQGNFFSACKSLETVVFPALTSIHHRTFFNCENLRKIDLYTPNTIQSSALSQLPALEALILRKDACVPLSGAFESSLPIVKGTAYVYVPRTLGDGSDGVATYQAATNWSAYASQIRAIEDYPEITGG